MDHQPGVVADVVVDQDEGQIPAKFLAGGLHHLLLVVEQHIHQFLQEGPFLVEHEEGVGHTHGQHGAVEERCEVGEDADPCALAGFEIAFEIAELGVDGRGRLQIGEVHAGLERAAGVVLGAV